MRRAAPRSREEWDQIMRRYAKSGLIQRDFCEREGISLRAFCSQRTRRKKRGGLVPAPVAPSAPAVSAPAQFIPVEVVTASPPAPSPRVEPEVVVELPLGVTLRFRGMPA